jgi:hypothetical protein
MALFPTLLRGAPIQPVDCNPGSPTRGAATMSNLAFLSERSSPSQRLPLRLSALFVAAALSACGGGSDPAPLAEAPPAPRLPPPELPPPDEP